MTDKYLRILLTNTGTIARTNHQDTIEERICWFFKKVKQNHHTISNFTPRYILEKTKAGASTSTFTTLFTTAKGGNNPSDQ